MALWDSLETNSDFQARRQCGIRIYHHSVVAGNGEYKHIIFPWILESFRVSLGMNYCREGQEQNSLERIVSSAAATPLVLSAFATLQAVALALRPLRSAWMVFHCVGLPRRLGVACSPYCRLETVFEHLVSPHCQTGKGWRKVQWGAHCSFLPQTTPISESQFQRDWIHCSWLAASVWAMNKAVKRPCEETGQKWGGDWRKGGKGYLDQEPLRLPRRLTDLHTNSRTSSLWPSQTPGNVDCFAVLDQEEHDVLMWWETAGQYHLQGEMWREPRELQTQQTVPLRET